MTDYTQTDLERGKRLADARTKAKLTQREVAVSFDLETSTVFRWERLGTMPRRKINQLARLYGVTASWLLFGIEDDDGETSPYQAYERFPHDARTSPFENAVTSYLSPVSSMPFAPSPDGLAISKSALHRMLSIGR